MKKSVFILALASLAIFSCQKNDTTTTDASATSADASATHSQDGIVDETSSPNIVKLAVGNKDLSTLVAAVQAADLTTALSNAGPFTVFAPLNSAFDKLPKGTVEDLLKPENKGKLTDILGHHTYVGVIKADQFTDGQTRGMVDGKNITIKMVDGKPTINGTVNIVASVNASNGVVHVVDGVILPQ
jgi:uncharacterized surface protein with fasciclin (FAS1) repeats